MNVRSLRRWVVSLGAVAALMGAEMSVCAAPAFAAIPGYEVVAVTSATDSEIYKSVKVECPAGKRVIGTGFRIMGGQGDIVLDDLIPSVSSVTVGAGEDQDGTSDVWSVTGLAVCADPMPGLEIVTASSPFGRKDQAIVTADCPTGKTVIGAGASLTNGWGEVSIRALSVLSIGTSIAAGVDQDRYTGSWLATVYSVCVDGRSSTYHSVTTRSDSTSPKLTIVDCPPGARPTGLGWRQVFSFQVLVDYADIRQSSIVMEFTEDDDGDRFDWSADATLICGVP